MSVREPHGPKLFQNLRASRATELAAEHPGHVAAEWLGHSTAVAQKHYWQVTDADFDRTICAAKTLQQSAAMEQSGSNEQEVGFSNPLDVRKSHKCLSLPVPPAGFEPATHGLGNRCSIP